MAKINVEHTKITESGPKSREEAPKESPITEVPTDLKGTGWKMLHPAQPLTLERLGIAGECPEPECSHHRCENCIEEHFDPACDMSPDVFAGDWSTTDPEFRKRCEAHFVRCCQCQVENSLGRWLLGKHPSSEEVSRHFHMTQQQYERELLAKQSELERGLLTERQLERWRGQWVQDKSGNWLARDVAEARRWAREED